MKKRVRQAPQCTLSAKIIIIQISNTDILLSKNITVKPLRMDVRPAKTDFCIFIQNKHPFLTEHGSILVSKHYEIQTFPFFRLIPISLINNQNPLIKIKK